MLISRTRTKGRSAGGRNNPFLTWTSTYEERQALNPVKMKEGTGVSVELWLEHLKSPFTFGQQKREKSPPVKEHDLKTYEKFWQIANGRGLLKQLFENLDLDEAQISRKMEKAGFNMSRAQVRFIRQRWCRERKTKHTEAAKHRTAILAAVAAHPDWSFDRIRQGCGIGPVAAAKITRKAGIKKPNIRFISSEERAAREQFLEDAGIKYPRGDELTSVEKMTSRCLHMLQTHNYVVGLFNPFLDYTPEKVDAGIAVLDHYGIDWRDYDKELWGLIRNSPKAIHDKMELFTDVGASSELHYLLLKKLSGKLKHYSSDASKYTDLRKAVIENDISSILSYVDRVTKTRISLGDHSTNQDYFDAARDAAVFVLSECSHPENNPAAFLTLMSAAIEVAISKKAKEFAMTHSAEEFSDGETARPIGERREPKE